MIRLPFEYPYEIELFSVIQRTLLFIFWPLAVLDLRYQTSSNILSWWWALNLYVFMITLVFCGLRMFAEVFWTVGAFFMKQIQCLEESAESLRERSLKFYKGCRKYTYVYTFRCILTFPWFMNANFCLLLNKFDDYAQLRYLTYILKFSKSMTFL